MTHYCSAIGCRRPRREDEIYCAQHWFALPKRMRDRLKYGYKNGSRSDHLINISRATLYLKGES